MSSASTLNRSSSRRSTKNTPGNLASCADNNSVNRRSVSRAVGPVVDAVNGTTATSFASPGPMNIRGPSAATWLTIVSTQRSSAVASHAVTCIEVTKPVATLTTRVSRIEASPWRLSCNTTNASAPSNPPSRLFSDGLQPNPSINARSPAIRRTSARSKTVAPATPDNRTASNASAFSTPGESGTIASFVGRASSRT
ncbi:MAG TPA: hypothetical protein VIO38_02805, partial [Rariglobus sp.]